MIHASEAKALTDEASRPYDVDRVSDHIEGCARRGSTYAQFGATRITSGMEAVLIHNGFRVERADGSVRVFWDDAKASAATDKLPRRQ